jgi:hypothetical protein
MNIKINLSISLFLILVGWVLLLVWPIKGTIALRNILLVLGAFLSVIFFFKEKFLSTLNSYRDYLSLISILLLFMWVLFRGYFFADTSQSLHELSSTWFRSSLALLFGLSIGALVARRFAFLNILISSQIVIFILLYFQYFNKIVESGLFFQPDFYGYILHGKGNVVLIGTLLIGILTINIIYMLQEKFKWYKILSCGTAILIVLYADIYLFDTRSGVLLGLIAMISAVALNYGKFKDFFQKKYLRAIYFFLPILCSTFFYLQFNLNAGWKNFVEDVSIGMQIEKNPFWINQSVLGIPKTDYGRTLYDSTYERTAWGVAGFKFLLENPMGSGVLKHSFGRELDRRFPALRGSGAPQATHSGWLDFGLAYGIPGLVLVLFPLISIINTGRHHKSIHGAAIGIIALVLLLSFLICELASEHGIELFFFWTACLISIELFLKRSIQMKDSYR